MRILHIGKFYPPFHGGIESFMAALVEEQLRRGHVVGALVHAHAPDGLPEFPPVDASRPWVARVPCHGRLVYAPVAPAFGVWLARALRAFQPDLLHLHVPNTSAFWALALPAARRLPWVVHWHADVVQSRIDRRLALLYGFYRPFETALLRRAARIIATSPPYLESSPTLAPWREKCDCVPLALPREHVPGLPAMADAWPGGGRFRLLAIGRLTYYKGFDVLLRALAVCPEANLVLVGAGELGATLREQIRALGLDARVRLLQGVSPAELVGLLDACDALCMPSLERTEAFGVVLLEALRQGKPVIASRIAGAGVTWVIDDGGNGLLAAPGDAGELATALRRMMDPDLRQCLARGARVSFDARFCIEAVADALDRIYQRLHPAG